MVTTEQKHSTYTHKILKEYQHTIKEKRKTIGGDGEEDNKLEEDEEEDEVEGKEKPCFACFSFKSHDWKT